jgi:WD40-like Beta Propeller Repeat
MARRGTLYLPVMIAAAVLMACAVALLAVSKEADATFPGKNGRIAYSAFGERTDEAIYTITPGGGAKTKVTRGYQPSYSPDGKKIAYTMFDGNDTEIYTINVGGGVRPNSPITTRTKTFLPTPPTAKGSPIRVPPTGVAPTQSAPIR